MTVYIQCSSFVRSRFEKLNYTINTKILYILWISMKTLPFTCSINTLLQEVTNTGHTLTPSRVAWGQEQPDADRSLCCVLFRKVAALSHSYHDVSAHAFVLPRHWCSAMVLPTHRI